LSFEYSDLITIALLVLLEGLLSADNAIVLAVLVMPLPPEEQKRALKYGIVGAFVFRFIAVLLAVYLLNFPVIKIIGGLYLIYLAVDHFFRKHPEEEKRKPQVRRVFGLTPFWSTVVAVELTDIVFSVDSILAAVALSPKQWVVITGGILGIITMRMVAGAFLNVIKRYPRLVDGAYVIVFFIGAKLFAEYFNLHLPKWITFLVVGSIFAVSMIWSARDKALEKQTSTNSLSGDGL
jgi:YkoY family integral membrane protein